MKAKTFELKDGIEAGDMLFLSPKLYVVWGYLLMFANSRGLPVVVTNFINKFAVSTSETHPDGRAIDVSTKKWTEKDIEDLSNFLEIKVGEFGAISRKTGKPRVIYYHEAIDEETGRSYGPHLHLQVSWE